MKKILIMAAGTGGHIFPAKAFAEKAVKEGYAIEWLGTKNGMESRLVTEYPMHVISMKGVRRLGFLRKLFAPLMLCSSFLSAYSIIKKSKPDIVMGFGGYVTVPGGLAAKCLKRKLIIHEQNAVAGLSNKLLSRLTNQTYEAFPDSLKNAGCIGNPIRQALLDLPAPDDRFEARESRINILVLGGSRGAKALNETIPSVLNGYDNINVRHQCGDNNSENTRSRYQLNRVVVQDFIEDMGQAYAWADLAICRAGALTVSELQAVGVPAIFIPYPNAVDDHQTKNAENLVSKGAAVILQQKILNEENLKKALDDILDRNALLRMAKKSYTFRKIRAVESLLNACEEKQSEFVTE